MHDADTERDTHRACELAWVRNPVDLSENSLVREHILTCLRMHRMSLLPWAAAMWMPEFPS